MLLYKKAACKMLVKLTPEVAISLFVDEVVTIPFSQTSKLAIRWSPRVVGHRITR